MCIFGSETLSLHQKGKRPTQHTSQPASTLCVRKHQLAVRFRMYTLSLSPILVALSTEKAVFLFPAH